MGTKFTVYDNGENPDRKPFIKETESLRQELAAICYVSRTNYSPDKATIIPHKVSTSYKLITKTWRTYYIYNKNYCMTSNVIIYRTRMFWVLKVPEE